MQLQTVISAMNEKYHRSQYQLVPVGTALQSRALLPKITHTQHPRAFTPEPHESSSPGREKLSSSG